jgi:hypothetical protein
VSSAPRHLGKGRHHVGPSGRAPLSRVATSSARNPTCVFVATDVGVDRLRRVAASHQHQLEHRATPERSLDQRMDALSRANEVRTLRAQLKRDLKARRVSIGALLDPPSYLEAAKVFDMLLALPQGPGA